MAEHKVEKINGGYILLARQILNSEIMDKPPMFLKLWVWMLERAHHKNGHKGLKRGQFLTSVKEMQDAMTHRVGARIVRPSSRKVRYMYERLSNCHMIDRSNVSEGMLITILNYNKYQDPKNYERPSELSRELSHELSPPYNKKDWGIRLTPVATICSIWLWTKIIRRRCLNSTTASVRRRRAGNICTSCVGLTGFIARVVAIRNIG